MEWHFEDGECYPRVTACGLKVFKGNAHRNLATILSWDNVTCRKCLKAREKKEKGGKNG